MGKPFYKAICQKDQCVEKGKSSLHVTIRETGKLSHGPTHICSYDVLSYESVCPSHVMSHVK